MLIVCNGMYRSGSTMQYNLVRNLIEIGGYGKGKGYFEWLSEKDFNELEERLFKWANSEKFYVIKTHEIIPEIEKVISQKKIIICYTYRDIREMFVSAKRFLKKDFEELIPIYDKAIDIYFRLRSIDNIIWQKYEDIIINPYLITNNLNEYISLEIQTNIVKEAIRQTSLKRSKKAIKEMKIKLRLRDLYLALKDQKNNKTSINLTLQKISEILQNEYEQIETYDKKTLLHSNHISDDFDKFDRWKEVLSPLEVKIITERYSSYLLDAGYLL